jgi:hypothetical protein
MLEACRQCCSKVCCAPVIVGQLATELRRQHRGRVLHLQHQFLLTGTCRSAAWHSIGNFCDALNASVGWSAGFLLLQMRHNWRHRLQLHRALQGREVRAPHRRDAERRDQLLQRLPHQLARHQEVKRPWRLCQQRNKEHDCRRRR